MPVAAVRADFEAEQMSEPTPALHAVNPRLIFLARVDTRSFTRFVPRANEDRNM